MKEIIKGLILAKAKPILLVGGAILFVVVIISAISGAIFGEESLSNTPGIGVACSQGDTDEARIDETLKEAGVFSGQTNLFIEAAEDNNIDPIILISISMHETGYGKSQAVKEKNNPGGLMNPKTGSLFVYASLQEGVDAMASNLYRLYISQGLLTIDRIGNKYAPIGVDNDPENLNQHWVPTVTNIVNKLGGLSMNCNVMGTGEFSLPVPSGEMTSPFGTRVHPITGEVHPHKGIDLGCSINSPILAADNGKVVVSVKEGWGGGYGHHIIIDHGDKYTLYGHLDKVNVNIGDTVSKGNPIGGCGSTGHSTGPHLHFEVQTGLLYGTRHDPAPFFTSEGKEDKE